MFTALKNQDGVNVVNILLSSDCRTLCDENGRTPLHISCERAPNNFFTRCVETFVLYGMNVNAAAKDGTTPLHHAASRASLFHCSVLLEHGAKFLVDKQGRTPLHYAAVSTNSPDAVVEICKLFVEAGVDVNIRDVHGKSALAYTYIDDVVDILVQHGGSADDLCMDSLCLHKCVLKGSVKLIQYFIEHNAPVNEVDARGRTPLHAVVLCEQSKEKKLSMIRVLLDGGVSIHARDMDNKTAFEYVNMDLLRVMVTPDSKRRRLR